MQNVRKWSATLEKKIKVCLNILERYRINEKQAWSLHIVPRQESLHSFSGQPSLRSVSSQRLVRAKGYVWLDLSLTYFFRNIRDNGFKNAPSKICERHPLLVQN